MLHDPVPNLDVQRLMHEIRASVVSKSTARHEGNSQIPDATNGNLKQKDYYHVNDLLRFHGDEFLRNAYRALLNREPDEAGLAHYLEGLVTGRVNKLDVLASLHSSPEGRTRNVRLDGLTLPVAIRRLGQLPFLGYLIRLFVAFIRLPRLVQHQNHFEFYTWSQQKRTMDLQDQHHRQLSETLQPISAQILELMQGTEEQQRATLLSFQQYNELRARFDALESSLQTRLSDIRENHTAQTTKLSEQLSSQLQTVRSRQQKLNGELLTQERRLSLLFEELERQALTTSNASLTEVIANAESHLLDGVYAAFEDQFRGPRDEVRRRLEVYLPILRQAQITSDVLDIGCGRGEFLQLLSAEGIQAQGVDRNRVFVEECRGSGLKVIESDALIHLSTLPDESLNAVTAFHVVEHLNFETLIRVLDEIVRTLKSGGILILETPNPENFMVGSCTFYTDPTHRNPIPSQTLKFLLELRGLGNIDILKLRPWDEAKIEGEDEIVKRFNEYFYSAPDYGIVARKT